MMNRDEFARHVLVLFDYNRNRVYYLFTSKLCGSGCLFDAKKIYRVTYVIYNR